MEVRNTSTNVALSCGSIAEITEGKLISNPLDPPILQVTDVKHVHTAQNFKERYRMMLSDGVHLQQSMLATQLNNFVVTGALKKGTVLRLNEFICNLIHGRKYVISFSISNCGFRFVIIIIIVEWYKCCITIYRVFAI